MPVKSPRQTMAALRYILRDAEKRVPFYAKAFSAAGVDSRKLLCIEDLQRFPITNKHALLGSGLREHLRQPERLGTYTSRSTSGTCGTPLTVYASRGEALFRKASLLGAFRHHVKLPFPLTIADVGAEHGKAGSDLIQRLRWVQIIRIFRSDPIAEQVRRMSCLQPGLVEGRPSSLWMLACEAQRQGVLLPQPRLVATFGEVLYPQVRQLLEQAFRCRVADFYNCEEVGNVAWECSVHPTAMHVNSSTAILEVVDEHGQAAPVEQTGRLLLTNLYNRTMPFIRYDIGDRAKILESRQCDCGFVGQTIRLIEGRDEDFFLLPDGRRVSPRNVYEAIADVLPFHGLGNDLFEILHGFQVIQETTRQILVNVIAGPKYVADLWQGVEVSVKTLHPEMRVRIRAVKALETSPGGKMKMVMSRVDSAHNACQQACDSPISEPSNSLDPACE